MELMNIDTEVRWRDYCDDPARVPTQLREALDAGRPILLASRFSTPTGEDARTSAINSLFEAARVLERQTGIDLERALPDREDLDLRLRSAPVTVSPRLQEGDALRHRFVTLDLRPAAPAIVLMATGSGRLAAEGFVQPFTRAAADLVWEHEVALVATKRWDRTTRNDQLVGPLLVAMDHHSTWVCTDRLLREMNGETRLVLMVESYAAGSNTGGEDHAKRLGQADRTDRRMVDGQAAYHLASSPAPGIGVATRKRKPHSPVERLIYLDTPACRPDPAQIADGMSEVRDEDGNIVDQVDNVRFFLANYGRPEWMADNRLLKELSRRRFSTVHLRRIYGADAYMTATRGYTAWQTILANLDLYETGILRRSVGGTVGDVDIVGVMPPDGPWAQPADFARIRAQMASARHRAGAKRRIALSGLTATYNGTACRTRVSYPYWLPDPAPRIAFNRVCEGGQERRTADHIQLPAATFAESIANGIIGAADGALQPLLATFARSHGASDAEHEMQRADIRAKLADVERRTESLVATLGETGPDGRPVLRGALLARVQAQYEELEREQTLLQAQHDQLDAEANPPVAAGEGADPAALPTLLASLRDLHDTTHTDLWPRIITDLDFRTGKPAADGTRRLTWSGTIRISDDAGDVAIPFEGAYDYRRTRIPDPDRHRDLALRYRDAMLAGTPFADIDLPSRGVVRRQLADQLGIAVDHPLFTCDDGDITRIATALLLHEQDPSVPLPEATPELLDAVRRVHVDDRSARPWRTPVRASWTLFYDLAAQDGTVTLDALTAASGSTPGAIATAFYELRHHDPNWSSQRKRGYRLAPCPRCGSHDRRPAGISEIRGLHCRACETDEAGVHWPIRDRSRQLLA